MIDNNPSPNFLYMNLALECCALKEAAWFSLFDTLCEEVKWQINLQEWVERKQR